MARTENLVQRSHAAVSIIERYMHDGAIDASDQSAYEVVALQASESLLRAGMWGSTHGVEA